MNDKYQILERLRNSIIVSCQSEGDDPFNATSMYMGLFARAAEMGGARGIRSEGIEKIKAIKKITKLPIIGLIKSKFMDGTVCITGSLEKVEQLINVGCDIIAIDGTFREREGYTGPDFIREVKQRFDCLVLADVATCDEAIACESAGADCVSTTLNGYTPDTKTNSNNPNFEILDEIIKHLAIPVFAEGRYNTPTDARKAMEMGAYGVIVGSAITRPRVITSWFVEAIKNNKIQKYDK